MAGIAAGALSRAAGQRLPMLPSGQLRQQVLDRVVVMSGGRSLSLQLVAHTGQGFEPSYLWLTTGASPRHVASLEPGSSSLIEEGWEGVLPQLTARQLRAEDTLLRRRAAAWLKPLPGLTVVRNARVFDSLQARLGPASDVYLFGGPHHRRRAGRQRRGAVARHRDRCRRAACCCPACSTCTTTCGRARVACTWPPV